MIYTDGARRRTAAAVIVMLAGLGGMTATPVSAADADAQQPQAQHESTSETALQGTADFARLKKVLGEIRFQSPFPGDVPRLRGEFGEMVKLGYLIFTDTQHYAGEYVNNGLNCRNCHLDAGARPGSAPLWAAYVAFPAYRSKNHLVNTFEDRLAGCFTYSMNGVAPPSGGKVLNALTAYSYWLAKGAPLGVELPGRHYTAIDSLQGDAGRGETLYAQRCALCHGADGQGTRSRDGDDYQFPPLWGPDSYNWGAGMHKDENFARFIKGNMPPGQDGSLTDQQAWDIAAWVNGKDHARPVRVHNP